MYGRTAKLNSANKNTSYDGCGRLCTCARRYMPTACRRSFIHAIALLRYFSPSLSKKVSSLTEKEVKEVNAGIAQAQEEVETVASGRGKYNAYTAQERAKIGKSESPAATPPPRSDLPYYLFHAHKSALPQ